MINGTLWTIVDDAEMRKLDEAAVHLLQVAGARIEHEHVLDLLEQAGGRVDRSAMRCRFPEKLIRAALANFKREIDDKVKGPAKWEPVGRMRHGGSNPHFLEWPDCRRRLATRQDITNMAKLAHVLAEFAEVGQVLTCSEVDPRIEPIWNIVERMTISNKRIGCGEVLYYQNIKHLVKLGELQAGISGANDLVAICNFSVAPLIFGRRTLECILEKNKFHCEHCPGTMPISGISSPVTIAGTVVMCLAELMVGWIIGYVLDPHLPTLGIVCSGSLDMRTLNACFSSPEARLQNLATVQICRQLYGIGIFAAWGYVDCKTPGLRAIYEKCTNLCSWPFVGGNGLYPDGVLSAGQDYSPLQHLLETELFQGHERYGAGFEVNAETLALDLSEALAAQVGANFLNADHTLAHYAAEQWYPRWLDRTVWQGDAREALLEHEMLARINRYWQDAVARYAPPALDQGKLAEARRILKSAEEEMSRL